MRIAVAGFQHETNTFAPLKADYQAFAEPKSFPPLVAGADLHGHLTVERTAPGDHRAQRLEIEAQRLVNGDLERALITCDIAALIFRSGFRVTF